MASSIRVKTLVICGWLALWQVLSFAFQNNFLFPTPLKTGRALFETLTQVASWQIIGLSTLQIVLGFLLALGLALVLATLSSVFVSVREIVAPVVTLFKSLPVAALIIILLVLVRGDFVAVWVCAFTAFPLIYLTITSSVDNVDVKLLEMAQVFKFNRRTRALYLYRSALVRGVTTGARVAIGFAWKSGIAAQVIGWQALTIGGAIYLAKLNLEINTIFAWSIIIIALGVFSEKLVIMLFKKVAA